MATWLLAASTGNRIRAHSCRELPFGVRCNGLVAVGR
jgi:hypothetical protein